MTIKSVNTYYKDKQNTPCPLTEKLVKAGYQQGAGGYILNAHKAGIEVDFTKSLPTQYWHLMSYCNTQNDDALFSKRIKCGELIFWMAEVSGYCNPDVLNELVDKIIKNPVGMNGNKPIYNRREWNDEIQRVCFDSITRAVTENSLPYKGIIYKYTFPNGKVYIGQTVNPKRRKADHLRESSGSQNPAFWHAYKKYGSVKYEVIEQIEDKTRDSLCDRLNKLEQKYIAEYHSTDGRHGYNLTTGGLAHIVTEEGRKHMSEGRTDKLDVLQYDLDGNFVREYVSCVDAAKAIGSHAGSVWSCCLGKASGKKVKKSQIVKGYTFRFKKDYPDVPSKIDLSISSNKRGVLQFTLDGVFVKEWNSIIEVQQTLGFRESGVRQCCYGKYRESNGFMWRFRDDFEEIPQKIDPVRAKISLPFPKLTPEQIAKRNKIYREKYAKAVIQYTFNGDYVAEYPSLDAAAKAVDGDGGTICNACKLIKSKSAFGFQWRYKSDIINPYDSIASYKVISGPKNAILQLTKDGNLVQEWKTVKDAAAGMKVNPNTLYMALNGRKEYVRGFIWRYKDKK